MMLSRTAAQLYWMSRYMERAENLARMLDVSHTLSLLPQTLPTASEISVPLAITGSLDAYRSRHGELKAETVLQFMTLDLDNPSSLLSCIKSARENAHAVRGKITAEMWENINATWLEARQLRQQGPVNYTRFFEWVKERSHLFRGATYGTMTRNDAFSFIRLGTFVERADNTARILDVKSHLVLPGQQEGAADYYLWSALLRSVSAFEAYQSHYRESITASRVAELLILRRDVPRSLRACFDEISAILPLIEGENGRLAKRQAAAIASELAYGSLDDILAEGLHPYLTRFLSETHALGEAIHQAYLEAA